MYEDLNDSFEEVDVVVEVLLLEVLLSLVTLKLLVDELLSLLLLLVYEEDS